MSSTERFGYEWDKYSTLDPNYELQFKRWVAPLVPSDFKDKIILDAGCGMGRNSYWALKWGATKVVGFDFDQRSVAAAKKNLTGFDSQAQVLYQSIYDIVWENQFDIVFSIGVIHHLEDPMRALQNMTRALKPGGRLLIWVYSYEGNEWIAKFVDPIRKNITSRLPVGWVHFLSYFVSIPLYLFIHISHGPTPYLKQLSTFKFRHVHSIVFDQLIPKVANYWKKAEVEALLRLAGLSDITVHHPENNMGWTGIGFKKGIN